MNKPAPSRVSVTQSARERKADKFRPASRFEADDAYSAELRRVFGKAAGDARYDARGVSTPELRRLADAALAANAAR